MKTVKTIFDKGKAFLEDFGVENPYLDAKMLLAYILGLTVSDLILKYEEKVGEKAEDLYKEYLDRRSCGEPVAKIIGKKGFWKYEFIVNENVLDPRADTETLIEAVVADFESENDLRILDIGTGSGCILLSILGEFKYVKGVGLDVSSDALEVAFKNSEKLSCKDRCDFVCCDFLNENLPDIGKFDLIVSNPPYIDKEDERVDFSARNFDPDLALFAEDNGLAFYKALAEKCGDLLNENGKVFIEIGIGQEKEIKKIFKKCKFKFVKQYKDLGNVIRVLEFRI